MEQRYRILLITCLAVVLIFVLITASMLFTRHSVKSGIYIYASIDECKALESLDDEGGKFAAYSDAISDQHIRDFQYSAFYGGEFSCKAYSFQLFAYEFNDAITAQLYFEKATGRNSDEVDPNYSLVSGTMSSRLIVLSGNKCYSAYFPTSALANVTQLLSEIFSVKIN